MHSPVTALLWERWRRTRWAMIAAILLPLSGWLIHEAGYDPLGEIVAVTFWVLGSILLTGMLLLGQCEMRSLDLAFPKRLFRFPVRTVTLLATNMGYGVVAIALPFLFIIGPAKVFSDLVGNWWISLLRLETGFIVLQTLAWLNGARAVFFFLVPSLMGVFTLLYLAAKFGLPVGVNVLCPAIIVLCCAISFWNVSADRRGAWISGWRWVDFLFSVFRKRRTKGFSSALHAQTWFESRQTGYLFPIATLGLIGPVVGLIITALILGDEPPSPASVSNKFIPDMLWLTMVAAWMAGLLAFAVYHRDRASGASSFWLRRPITTRILAVARLQAMARSVASVMAILTVVALAWLAREWAAGVLPSVVEFVPLALEDNSLFEIGVMAVLSLWGFVFIFWTFLELAPTVMLATFVLAAVEVATVLLFFEGDFALFLRRAPFFGSDLLRWSAGVLAAGLIVGALGTFYVASRRKLISTATLVGAACAFPLAVVSLWAFQWWIWANRGSLSLMGALFIISAATVPFIPLVTVPLLIAKLRHR